MLLLLFGCNPCDVNALSSAESPEGVVAACELPAPLVEWYDAGVQEPPAGVAWSCSAPALDSPRIASRRAVHAACGLGEEHDFVFSDGQPYLAVALTEWAKAEGVDADLGTPFLGEPVIPNVELPIVEVRSTVQPSGAFSTLARDARVSELNEGPVRLVVQNGDDWLHLVELEPGSSDIKLRLLPDAVMTHEGGTWRYHGNRDIPELHGPVEVIANPDDTIEEWLKVVVAQDRPLRGASVKCEEPPEGMVCVPSGVVDSEVGVALLPTFYVDADAVTDDAYQSCVTDGFCKSGNADQLSYLRLEDYCTWSGKRVATEWEWQAATEAGAISPTRHEWSVTYWHDEDPDEVLVDPWGPCGGGYPCSGNTSKVMKGPKAADRTRTSRGNRAGGGRCVTRDTTLATWPPQQLTKAPEQTWSLTPLSDEDLALVDGIGDDAIDEVPICTDRVGLSSLDCKDPVNHVVPNEERYHVVLPYLTNRGGGYVGVASDQNYTFVVEAKSEYAWFMDYDVVIVHLHQVARAAFLASDTREDFVAWYAPDAGDKMEKLLDETYPGNPDLEFYKSHYQMFSGKLFRHYNRQMAPDETWGDRGWLRTEDNYVWIRDLWRTGRARTVKGNMLGDKAMKDIGAAAGKLGVPIRIYYTSNAPSAWGSEMTPSYSANVRALPMDEQSIVLQVFGFKTGFGQTGYWHYNIQSGPQQQDNLSRYDWLWQVYWPALPTDDDDVTVSGLPGAAERKPVTRTYVTPTY